MASIVTRVLLALALLLAAAGPARAGEPAVAPAEMARMLDDAVALAAFLGGDAALGEEERERVRAAEARDIARDPAGQRAIYRVAAKILERARSDDPAVRAQAREETLMAVFFGPMDPEASSAVLDAALARNPVVAADPELRWAVTRKGLEALVRSNAYVAELAGQRAPPTDLAALEAEVARGFAAMPKGQKELLVFAERRAAALRGLVDAMAAPQRAASVAWLKARAPTPDKVPEAARLAENEALLAPLRARLDGANAAMNRAIGLTGVLGVLQSPGGRP